MTSFGKAAQSNAGKHAASNASNFELPTGSQAVSHGRLAIDGKPAVAVFAGLLILTSFFAQGCSEGKPVESSSPNSVTPNSRQVSSSPIMPAVSGTPSVPTPVVKKPVRKRPSTVTYKESAYGVSFRYPRKYMLKTGDEAHPDLAGLGPVPTNFAQPGAVTIVSVEMPRSSYPGTDFASAFFNVSVNRSLAAAECGQFAVPVHVDNGTVPDSKIKLGGMEFAELEDAMQQSDAKYYHVFENGACYEFALGMGTLGSDTHDESGDGISPVDRGDVFRKLEKILATVKIQPEPVPEVAGPVHPSEESKN